MQGLWLPIITPFKNNSIDLKSYRRLIDHYIDSGISGLMPLGTTGESPAVLPYEKELLIHATLEYVEGRVPVVVGYGGNHTASLVKGLKKLEGIGIKGILSVSPYYNRPSQEGIYQHFTALAQSTDLDIVLYNIPYRTGRNMTNETLRRLADHDRIIALKDACGDFSQSVDLLTDKPDNFDVLSGEDATLLAALTSGATGTVCASAHLMTDKFKHLITLVSMDKLTEARSLWQTLYPIVPMAFGEPNPAPIKHLLKLEGLIDSDELRLPMTPCSDAYKTLLTDFSKKLA